MAEVSSANLDLFYDSLKTEEIVHIITTSPQPPSFHVSARLRRDKRQLIEKLVADGPHWTEALASAVANKMPTGRSTRQSRRAKQREQQRMERAASDSQNLEGFLDLPSETDIIGCYREFYKATSKEALRSFICAVCARLLNQQEEKHSRLPLCEVPNRERLHPTVPHAAQTLIDGCLLEQRGCVCEDDSWRVNICSDCWDDLNVSS